MEYARVLYPALLRCVPAQARRILVVGCAEGQLGAALKDQDPRRQVFGIEQEPETAAHARGRLDQVFILDIAQSDPPLEPGSIDCIVYGAILEHLLSPEDVLRLYRRYLSPQGTILCSIANLQHYSLLTALLTGDFPYQETGLLDATHLRFYTSSTILKLLLDAGFAPQFVDAIKGPCPADLSAALQPLLQHLGLHRERMQHYLEVYQYIVQGTPLPTAEEGATTKASDSEAPLSFVVCVSNAETFEANLRSSPCLRPGSPHEVLAFPNCTSAAEGLNQGLARARNPIVVYLHQDVYLPAGWPERFHRQYRLAERAFGPLGAAGVYGVSRLGTETLRAGHVVDRDRLLRENQPLPAVVETLDELLLALPRDTPLQFDPDVGFHFYGADICLSARERGLPAVVLDALCLHNSRSVGLPAAFHASAARFAAKWARQLPLVTSCVFIDRQGQLRVS